MRHLNVTKMAKDLDYINSNSRFQYNTKEILVLEELLDLAQSPTSRRLYALRNIQIKSSEWKGYHDSNFVQNRDNSVK